ncbi:HAD-IIB family hydrolase [Parasphingorhabdus sp.]|uniref:HAD-IIB family hydrolase n=1 Tax=Parasphingorhabdus sp. TaxID=2709688 RepID=UPI003A949410
MPDRPVYPLIFTDLDGTLLDHHSYSAAPADALIRQLADRTIACVIPITSKTRAEWRSLQQSLAIDEVLSVTENGSVIHAPRGLPFVNGPAPHNIMLGIAYTDILQRIGALPPALRQHIAGFADMSAEEVAAATGLTVAAARLASEREATEPFLWSGSDADMDQLRAIMAKSGIEIQRGGRFYHFTGHATKEQAMARTRAAFAGQKPEARLVTIALGDGPNDLAMIEAADFGVIMPNPDGVTIRSGKAHVRTAPAAGPGGWVIAVREIFSELGLILPES